MVRKAILLVLVTALAALNAVAQETRNVRLTVADDVGIIAVFYPVAAESAPALVLLHDIGQSRNEWTDFAPWLQRNGIAALAVDLRGHGDSTRRLTAQGPVLVDYRKFSPRDFQDMLLDVNAAADWLAAQRGVDPKRIGVIGSGFGANLALRYAAFNEELAALVLFSPGLDSNGVRTDDAIKKLAAQPLRIYVSRNDGFAFESCKRLMAIRKETGHTDTDKELTVCTGPVHGAQMLKSVQGLPQLMLSWLRQTLLGLTDEPVVPPQTPPPPVPTPPEPKPKPKK